MHCCIGTRNYVWSAWNLNNHSTTIPEELFVTLHFLYSSGMHEKHYYYKANPAFCLNYVYSRTESVFCIYNQYHHYNNIHNNSSIFLGRDNTEGISSTNGNKVTVKPVLCFSIYQKFSCSLMYLHSFNCQYRFSSSVFGLI